MPKIPERPETQAQEAKPKPPEKKAEAKPVAKPKKKALAERPVLYPEYEAIICTGESAVTVQQMKDILGWEVIPKEDKEGEPLLTDHEGNKVRCLNNVGNRPFNLSWAQAISQDVLNRRFGPKGPNGETIIIGKTGTVLSAQHRGIGLVLAGQLWAQEEHWKKNWPEEPTMETFVVRGIDESHETVRTLDNVRPRSLTDVLFTEGVFASATATEQKALNRALAFAVSFLWSRTGMGNNAFIPRQTHGEAIDFIQRHKRLVDCVLHIHTENANQAITKKLSLGYASALMYLMGASATLPEKYHDKEILPSEKRIDFENWDKACEFFVLLGQGGEGFKHINQARRPVEGQKEDAPGGFIFAEGDGQGSQNERIGVLIKAWNAFLNGSITPSALKLAYKTEKADDGTITEVRLIEYPSIGGIDLGNNPISDEDEDEEASVSEVEKTKAEIDGKSPNPERRAKAEKAVSAIKKLRDQSDKAKAPGEVPSPEKTQHDSEGKPPAPKLKTIPKPAPKPAPKKGVKK